MKWSPFAIWKTFKDCTFGENKNIRAFIKFIQFNSEENLVNTYGWYEYVYAMKILLVRSLMQPSDDRHYRSKHIHTSRFVNVIKAYYANNLQILFNFELGANTFPDDLPDNFFLKIKFQTVRHQRQLSIYRIDRISPFYSPDSWASWNHLNAYPSISTKLKYKIWSVITVNALVLFCVRHWMIFLKIKG